MATITLPQVENLHPTRAEVICALRLPKSSGLTYIAFNQTSGETVTLPAKEWNELLDAARDGFMAADRPSHAPIPPPPAPGAPRKCIVKGCTNTSDKGMFVGELCQPCHTMITTGTVRSGTTFIHEVRERLTKICNLAA